MITLYDVFKHGIGTRVQEQVLDKHRLPVRGRRGIVVDIIETTFEYIEPVIKWDGDEKPTVQKGFVRLILEPKHD